MKNLVIVESPAKAKTIEKYLGKDFKVLSSVGHIRSIPTKPVRGKQPIDIKNGFATIYQVDRGKSKVIKALKDAVKQAETVWLATDEDREGEAIAWHLCQVLNLDLAKTKRIVFHEITKTAITEAIKNPRTVDMQLVQAQQARQILDRLVGFELSPVVWRKVPGGKSAGRVQSPAVRLIVEKEQQIRDFAASFEFKISAKLAKDNSELTAETPKRAKDEAEAKQIIESFINSQATVKDIESKITNRNPQAPFTTSSLQQTANSKLGFSSKRTMAAAQKLYQAGKITYMRTDSTNLSGQIIAACGDYIKKEFGEQYHKSRNFATKSKSAQEAHEAIRPTNVALEQAGKDATEQKLYDLIRKRTIASQMAPAKINKTTVKLTTDKTELVAKGETIDFAGFLAIYHKQNLDKLLPPLKIGDKLNIISAEAKQIFKKPTARYTEGSLVKKLEELGIGRPSTYATIIDTIQQRQYVEKGTSDGEPQDIIVIELKDNQISTKTIQEKTGSNKGKLVPTPIGELLNTFLTTSFEQVVDYGFTANVETEFDKIAAGEMERNKMLNSFYGPFHKLIEASDGVNRADISKDRQLGIDPKTKLPVIARLGRYGPMLQLGQAGDDKKPKFAPMPEKETIDSVTLEKALTMFQLPRLVGRTKKTQYSEADKDIKANIGRFGPYIQVDKTFVSIKPLTPFDITLEQAQEIYDQKLEQIAKQNIATFGEIKVLNGRYGPYINYQKKNYKIPKSIDPQSITEEQAKQIIADSAKPKTKAKSKTKSKAKTKKSN